MSLRRRVATVVGGVLLVLVASAAASRLRTVGPRGRSVDDVIDHHGQAVDARLAPRARRAGLAWPPRRLTLLAFKEERVLEVWAGGKSGKLEHLASYSILAASGGPGPKRREGDLQVPEGFYRLVALNP